MVGEYVGIAPAEGPLGAGVAVGTGAPAGLLAAFAIEGIGPAESRVIGSGGLERQPLDYLPGEGAVGHPLVDAGSLVRLFRVEDGVEVGVAHGQFLQYGVNRIVAQLVVGGGQAAGGTVLEDIAEYASSGAHAVLYAGGVVDRRVEVQPVEYLLVELDTGRVLAESAVAEDTVLVKVREGGGVTGGLVSARDAQVVILAPGGPEGFFLPVYALYVQVILHALEPPWYIPAVVSGLEVAGSVARGVEFQLEFYEFVRAEHFQLVGQYAVAGRSVVGNLGPAVAAFLGGYQYDAVRSPGPVDCGGRSVLEHLDGLDVLVGQVVDSVNFESVHDVERRTVAVDGSHAPDLYVESGSGSSIGRDYVDSGNLAPKGVQNAPGLEILDRLGANRRYAAGKVAPLHGAVAYDHNLFQEGLVGQQGYVYHLAGTDGLPGCLEAYVTESEDVAVPYRKGVGAVVAGYRAGGGAFYEDAHSG